MKIAKQEINFISDGLVLRGFLYYPLPKKKYPGVLFIQGGGKYKQNRYLKWQAFLAKKGYASLSFFCRGVGNSEGRFEDSSLKNRLRDSENALVFFKKTEVVNPNLIALSGSSMGAQVAVRMLERNKQIKVLILQSGAAYSQKAENQPLNKEFTQIISSINSWQDSPVWRILEKFSGNLGVFYGEKDKIIPEAIKQKYHRLIKQGQYQTIKNGKHKLLVANNQLEEQAQQELFRISLNFLNRSFG